MSIRLFREAGAILLSYLRHNGPLFARGIAYSLLLGSMPLLLLGLAAASYLYEQAPDLQSRLEELLATVLPEQVTELMMENLTSFTGDWARFGGIGLIIMFLVSKGIFDAIGNGLIGVTGARRHRIPWVDHFYSLALTLLTIMIVVLAAMDNVLLTYLPGVLDNALGIDIYPAAIRVFTLTLMTVALFIIYALYATVRLHMLPLLTVALAVSLLWYGLGYGGQTLVLFTGRRTLLYGVLAGAVLFLFWLQIFSHLILLGGMVIFRWSEHPHH